MITKLTNYDNSFLSLLRTQYNNCPLSIVLEKDAWKEIFRKAQTQGLTGVIFEIVEKLPKENLPPKDVLIKWFVQSEFISKSYFKRRNLSLEYVDALAEANVKCIGLKGLVLSSYYRKPEHRVFGDMDCFLIDENKDNAISAFEKGHIVARKLGARINSAGYKHSHIHYKDLLIENHKYLTNFNETKQGSKIERLLQKLVREGITHRYKNSNLWMPSPEFNVLFLLNHSLGDFIAQDMSFRNVYDWAVFIKNEQASIDWGKMNQLLDECKLHMFFDVMTYICIKYLGLEITTVELKIKCDDVLAESVVYDILHMPNISPNISVFEKLNRIRNRISRMYKYSSLETESFWTLVWNTFSYCSYLNREVILR